MSEEFFVFTSHNTEENRLDKFLVDHLPEFSRSRLQILIKNGYVTMDDQPALKVGEKVQQGQQVKIHIPPPVPTTLEPESIPLQIIYENNDLMVINKPAGMVVHPSAGHATGTLVHAALAHAPDLEGVGGEQRPGIVHRLDKDTSGVLLVAKNDKTLHWLQEQFSNRQVKKFYLTLVDGHPTTPTGRIEAAVGRDSSHRQQMAVVADAKGRLAISEYRVLKQFSKHTLIEVNILTGRTHQVRLHMAFIGCPVTGDTLYGYKHPSVPISRHFLHAARLEITLLGETQPRLFEAPLPPDLEQVLSNLK